MQNNPNKILHIISNRWHSALTEYALCATESLFKSKQNAQSKILTLSGSPAEKISKQKKIHLQSLDSFSLKKIFKIYQIIKEFNPSHIIFYEGKESTLGLILKPFLKGVTMVRFFGRDIENLSTGASAFLKYKLSNLHIEKVLTPSLVIRNRLEKHLKSKQHATIYLGRDIKTFFFNEQEARYNEDRPMLIFLGRLDPVKGHYLFLKTYANLLQKWKTISSLNPPVLTIIGEPKNISEQTLKSWIKELDIPLDCIDLKLCFVDNLDSLLNSATVGIINSQGSEVICRTGEEFLLKGMPIVIQDVGALKELSIEDRNEDTYCLSSTHQENNTTQELIQFIDNAFNESTKMRIERASLYQKKYSLEKMADEIFKFLQS